MKKICTVLCIWFLNLCSPILGTNVTDSLPHSELHIIGGGIIGALESYYAYKESQQTGKKVRITVYEKGANYGSNPYSTNTAYNIVPSLTVDEILSVVPRGSELVEKLGILFSQTGGIRVDDVPGVNDSWAAMDFKQAVELYGTDLNHDDRTWALLCLGQKSMELWEQMYDEADTELQEILDSAHFQPCHEPRQTTNKILKDGYRIDLIYGFPNAYQRAYNMQKEYQKLGYQTCSVLSPDEVVEIDPSLTLFCQDHSYVNENQQRVWNEDSIALWRPGGCIDTRVFLPKLYAYLQKKMGQYKEIDGSTQNFFQIEFEKEVIGLDYALHKDNVEIQGLYLSDGTHWIHHRTDRASKYVLCPGESVGTLRRFALEEPSYAGFGGASLLLTIPIAQDQIEKYKNFFHCMEVHSPGVTLAWRGERKDSTLCVGVGGTKAFYGDVLPDMKDEFAENRHLLQLNMINQVVPEWVGLALGYKTQHQEISYDELCVLEKQGIAKRWVGRRAVAYDGFPTLGAVYHNNKKVANARCTTHLGSGGVSFGPGVVLMSRSSEDRSQDEFVRKILMYADSRRKPGPD